MNESLAADYDLEPAPRENGGVRRNVALTLEMIKFSHTIFGMPFALLGAVLAADAAHPLSVGRFVWIVLACVFARSAAMSFNRLHDEQFDRLNPRTKGWPLPAGLLTRKFVAGFCGACVVGFVISAAMLNTLALLLSPVALTVLLGYSTMKRFTPAAHFVLGLALGIAPVGAWVAVRGSLALAPILLGLGVMLWTAGFDIIYSCQDEAFDRKMGLKSIPARLGRRRALAVSALCHGLAILLFASIIALTKLGNFYLLGLALCAILLAYEQSIVTPSDMSRLGRAFFTINGWVSVLLFVCGLVDVMWL